MRIEIIPEKWKSDPVWYNKTYALYQLDLWKNYRGSKINKMNKSKKNTTKQSYYSDIKYCDEQIQMLESIMKDMKTPKSKDIKKCKSNATVIYDDDDEKFDKLDFMKEHDMNEKEFDGLLDFVNAVHKVSISINGHKLF